MDKKMLKDLQEGFKVIVEAATDKHLMEQYAERCRQREELMALAEPKGIMHEKEIEDALFEHNWKIDIMAAEIDKRGLKK